VLISTMNDIPGYEITEVLGEVFGLTVRSRNIGSQFGAAFKSMAGGELKGMTKNLVSSRNEVIERMTQEAQARGGDAVVAFRFDTSEMGQNWTEICAYGTAVKIQKKLGLGALKLDEAASGHKLAERADATGPQDSADSGRRAADDRLDSGRQPPAGARDQPRARAVHEGDLRGLEDEPPRPALPDPLELAGQEGRAGQVELTPEQDGDRPAEHDCLENRLLCRRIGTHAATSLYG
jgi:uncharacterized protein YbjQ (UPF0145 family)